SFFEPRFGMALDHVRVHTDGEAAEAARGVMARAYTAQNHIVFSRGEYAPHTTEGRRLLAHELTHVVQQGAGGAERPAVMRDMTPAAPAQAAGAQPDQAQPAQTPPPKPASPTPVALTQKQQDMVDLARGEAAKRLMAAHTAAAGIGPPSGGSRPDT